MKPILLFLSLSCTLFCGATSRAATPAKTNEAALIEVLQSNASNREKSDACAKLKLVATAKSVKALSALLTNTDLSHSARHVLETIPDSSADRALRKALPRTSGGIQTGIINTIGMRRDSEAIDDLGKLLSASDKAVAAASAEALGRIGGPSALKKLQASLPQSVGQVHKAEVDAILVCANRLLNDGKSADALKVFQSLYASETLGPDRQAAFRGMVLASGPDGVGLVVDAIADGDFASRSAGLHAAVNLKGPEATKALADLAVGTKVPLQLALIDCLVQRDDPAAMLAMEHLAESQVESVRLAAIAALGSLGDDSTVELLAKKAASAPAPERNAARQALLELNRGPVTARMLAMLNTDLPKLESELLRAIGGRGDSSATPTLLNLAQNGKEDERAAALEAVGLLADASHIPQLVQLVAAAGSDDVRAQAADALGSVYARVAATTDSDVEPLVKAVTTGSVETRVALLPICSELSQKSVREAVRAAVKDSDTRIRDAGIHALSETHDPALLPDLLDLADGKGGDSARALAIRGCVHLTSQEDDVKFSKDQKLDAYTQLLKGKLNADQKRLVLSGIATVDDPRAIDLASGLLNDPDVQNEAEQAVIATCKYMAGPHPAKVRAALNKVIAESKNADNRKAAQNAIDLMKK